MTSKIVAFHEAAHAVMCLSHGIPFKKVTIIPDGSLRGHVDTGGHQTNGLFEFVGMLEVLFSGFIAQCHQANAVPKIQDMNAGDRNQITKLLRENKQTISKNESSRFMEWVFFRAHLHLVQRWKQVERIAQALQASRTLTYEECKELMTDHGA